MSGTPRYNAADAEEGGRGSGLPAGKLDDRTAPDTVPMKAVPQQCGALGRVRPALRLCRGAMDRPARLYVCARCRAQVVLCSRCDRGNRYCGRACRRAAREAAQRLAAQRYQRSWRGRIAHAQRSRRWRQRRCAAAGGAPDDAQNVTHQGSQPAGAAAQLEAWTCDIATVGLPHTPAGRAADPTVHSAPPQRPVSNNSWTCRRCGARQPAALRLGFVRHGLPARRRHDHGP